MLPRELKLPGAQPDPLQAVDQAEQSEVFRVVESLNELNRSSRSIGNTIGNSIGNSIKKIRIFPIPLLKRFRFIYNCL